MTSGMTDIQIRPCRREEWDILADHEYAMWRDIGAAPDQIRPDWRARTLRFIEDAAEYRHFQATLAVAGDRIVGSACGQIFAGLSPDILEPQYKRKGYIWDVYVIPDFRRRGIARALTAAVTEHLRAVGCTQIHLNASAAGRSVYEKLGFTPANEMRLMVTTKGQER